MKHIFRKLKDKMNFGIRTKLLASYSIIIILTTVALISFIAFNYSTKLENNNIRSSNQTINNLISNLNEYFDEIVGISNQAIYNNDLQDLISDGNYIKQTDPDEPDLVKAYMVGTEIFGSSFDSRKNVTAIIVFNENGILLYKSMYGLKNNLSDFKSRQWYKDAIKENGFPVISGIDTHTDITGSSERVFSVSRMIECSSSPASGVILIDANLNTIINICNSVKLDKDGQLFVLDGSGSLVYRPASGTPAGMESSGSAVYQEIFQEFRGSQSGNFNMKVDNRMYQIVFDRLLDSGWITFTMTPYSVIMEDVNQINVMIIIIASVSLILMITVIYLLLSNIMRPLFELKKCMDSSESGDHVLRAQIKTKDEFGMLASSYNHMLDRIRGLMDQVVTEQKKIRKSEMKALQAQINPHFLYNTLDTIVWMAEMKNENIVPTTEALAKFFRISLSRGQDLIPIADELEHVRNYMVIQSMRYTNKFDYEINANEKVRKYKTLKIILQPIVENAIYHGIKKMTGKGLIRIDVIEDSGKILFVVTDNGVGMEPEKCSQILDGSYRNQESDGSGVGIRNVNERIKLYFGNEYGIKIESEPGKGTKVYVQIPLVEE